MLDEDGQRLKGALDGAGCGAIILQRAGAAQPSAEEHVPSAQVQFSDELLKLNREVFQLYQAGAYDQALAKANEAVALAERLYGPDHPTAAAELKFVVQVLRAAGRSAEAEPLIRRALAIDEKTLGSDDPTVALDIQTLVGVLIDKTLKDAQPPAQGNRILLTGQLPEILEKAVPLALIASLLLLWIYRRAVQRSMGRRSGAGEALPSSEDIKSAAPPPAMPLQFVMVCAASMRDMAPSKLDARRLPGPWRNAAIYTIAGIGYVLVLTAAYLYAGGMEFLPVRFVFFAVAYAWPIVLTIGLVAPVSWRGALAAACIYFLMFAAISAIGVARSDAFTWDQAARLWLLTNIPGTFLILAFLPRPIRAMGPLVLAFMVAAVAGSSVWHDAFNSGGSELMLRAVDLFASLGLNNMNAVAAATFAAELIGVAMLSLIGWAFLRGLGRLYLWRLISDQSVLIDSLWFLFALTSVVDFAFFGDFWFLAPLGAFAIYKLIALVGFTLFGEKPAGMAADPKLLLLRVFSLGKRSARLFNAFAKQWRHVGHIRLIAGPDLATSTVEPHEFLDFISGKLGRRFISGPDTLARRLSETEQRRDFDGRYRVDDFFCHDDSWQMVLKRLARDSDAVLMDLRGFLPDNQGCVFEINELLNVVPLGRVVFVVDATTDLVFLRETFARGWAAWRPVAQPRLGGAPGAAVRICRREERVRADAGGDGGCQQGSTGPGHVPGFRASAGYRCVSGRGRALRSLCLTAHQLNWVPILGVTIGHAFPRVDHHTQGELYPAASDLRRRRSGASVRRVRVHHPASAKQAGVGIITTTIRVAGGTMAGVTVAVVVAARRASFSFCGKRRRHKPAPFCCALCVRQRQGLQKASQNRAAS